MLVLLLFGLLSEYRSKMAAFLRVMSVSIMERVLLSDEESTNEVE